MTAIDTESGDEVWSEPQDTFGEVFYIDGRLYHTTTDGEEMLTLDGKVEWRIDDSSRLIGEMDEYVYAATQEELRWYDTESGDRLGNVEMEPDPLGAWNGFVYGYTDDALYAYDHGGDEPSQAWRTPFEGNFEIQGNWFTIGDGTLHVRERGGQEKRLGRYDAEDGTAETTDRRYQDLLSFVAGDGVEYLVTSDQDDTGGDVTVTLTAHEDGVLWERSFDTPTSNTVVTDDAVLLDGHDGELLALDPDTGNPLRRRSDSVGFLAVVDDSIYVLRNGTVRALR